MSYCRTILFILLCLTSLLLVACDEAESPTTPPDAGTLNIRLTDAPGDFEQVNITFSEVSVHLDSQWITITDIGTTVNLIELSSGNSVLLGSQEVPAGTYTQIRLKIDTAWVVVEGVGHELTVPSGAQTGLKFGPQFTVNEGSTVDLMIDFDVNRSVVTTGPPSAPRSYLLKPTVRLIATANSGSISGLVTNPQNLPLASAQMGDSTVTSTAVDPNTGEFMLAFLPGGRYTVAISDTMNYTTEITGVEVVAGTDNDVGMITLEP